MIADEEGFLYPSVDKSLCINCGACDRVCPELNNHVGGGTPKAYAAYTLDDEIRAQSSSGGIFSVLASYVLNNGGVVFGAAFDDDFNVHHICVDKEADMYKLRGSKYLQSRTEDSFAKTKQFLNEGRKVLFSGTPCQIAGLHNYLGKDYENLVMVDLICHGTPSPLVWQKYLSSIANSDNGKIKSIFFRNKTYGWRGYSISVEYDDAQYISKNSDNKYIKAFIRDVCLRPSCYNCPSKGLARSSDITLADFWGIENLMSEMDDDKGTSLVMIHSEKGEQIFADISKNIKCKPTDFNEAIKHNPSMLRSVYRPKDRDKFMKAILSGKPFDKMVDKYCRVHLKTHIRRLCGKVLRKLKLR